MAHPKFDNRLKTLTAVLIAVLLSVAPLLGVALSPVWADPLPIQHYVLPNGHEVYIQENHSSPIVTIDTWVDTGSVNETEANNGVSHFLEHLLFKGTPTHPVRTFEADIESKGGVFNAATSNDFTHYHITIASPFTAFALERHADMLMNASIPLDELDHERKVVQEEINRAEDNPMRHLFRAVNKQMYGNHGYALDTLGPKELIGTIPREDILAYYHFWYRPEHFKTVVVGDVNPKTVLAQVEEAFSHKDEVPSKFAYHPPASKVPDYPTQPQADVITNPKITQTYSLLAFPGPSIQNREDSVALDVAMSILGKGRSSRLVNTLQEKKQLVTSISAGNYTQAQAGMVYVMFQAPPDKIETAFSSLNEEIETILETGLTQAEVDKIKTQYVKEFIFQNESTNTVAELIGYNVTIGELSDYTDYINQVEKVTPERALRALQKYLDYQKAVFVSVVPKPVLDIQAPVVHTPDTDAAKTVKSATAPAAQPPKPAAPSVQKNMSPCVKADCSGLESRLASALSDDDLPSGIPGVSPSSYQMASASLVKPVKMKKAAKPHKNVEHSNASENKLEMAEAKTQALAAKPSSLEGQVADRVAAVPAITATLQEVMTPQPYKVQLNNGMVLVGKPLTTADTFALKIFIRGGQWVEQEPGVSELVARMLTQGTTSRTAEDIHEEMERQGFSIAVDANPDYVEVSANAVAEDAAEAMVLLSDLVNHPTFPADETLKEKTRLAEQLQASRDNPMNRAFENLTLALYPKHPYGHVGQRVEAALPKIQPEILKAYHQQWFHPTNMVVSAVGSFEPSVLQAYLEGLFPKSNAPSPKLPAQWHQRFGTDVSPQATAAVTTPASKAQQVVEKKPNLAATWVAQGWYAPGIHSPDYLALKVLNTHLGSGMSSQLFVNLREKKGLAYAVGSMYPSHLDLGQFVLYIGTDPKNETAVIDGFQTEVNTLQQQPLSGQALSNAKDKLKGLFALAHETPMAQAFYLGFYEALGRGYQFDAQYAPMVEQVQEQDVLQAAQKLFSGNSLTSIVAPAVSTTAKPTHP